MTIARARRMVRTRRWLRESWQNIMEDWEANFIILALIGVVGCAYISCTT